MSPSDHQQPLQRTVGRRVPRDGRSLTSADRASVAANVRYRTRAPKGAFRYRSHADMNADRDRWTVDLMVARAGQG